MSLAIEGVSKSFGGVQVLENVSLTVSRSGKTGIVGPNGAGKSTLFAVISGFQTGDTGSITFEGKSITFLSAVVRARLGLVRTFQVPRPFVHLTLRENLLVAAPNRSGESVLQLFVQPRKVFRQSRDISDRADEIIDFLRLGAVAKTLAGKLSGGQLKLLELARALMARPSFVLLDEPFAGVNAVLVEQISEHIRLLNQRGIGFLVIEHNLNAISSLCDALIVLDRGSVIASGSPQDVLSNSAVQHAYIGGT